MFFALPAATVGLPAAIFRMQSPGRCHLIGDIITSRALAEHVNLIPNLLNALLEEAAASVLEAKDKNRRARRRRVGATLRPGAETPLWNELRTAVHLSTRKYGDQVKLARILGLPRQRVNSYLTGGGQMPDAERTLLLIGWLAAHKEGKPMS